MYCQCCILFFRFLLIHEIRLPAFSRNGWRDASSCFLIPWVRKSSMSERHYLCTPFQNARFNWPLFQIKRVLLWSSQGSNGENSLARGKLSFLENITTSGIFLDPNTPEVTGFLISGAEWAAKTILGKSSCQLVTKPRFARVPGHP